MAETHIDNLLEGHKEIKDVLSGLQKGAWGLAIAIAAWALLQVYDKLLTARPIQQTPPASYQQR